VNKPVNVGLRKTENEKLTSDLSTSTSRNEIQQSKPEPDSAIHRHLLYNENCRLSYRDLDFSVICRARSRYHLEVLEAVHIALSKPVLCVQKSYVVSLHLVNTLVA